MCKIYLVKKACPVFCAWCWNKLMVPIFRKECNFSKSPVKRTRTVSTACGLHSRCFALLSESGLGMQDRCLNGKLAPGNAHGWSVSSIENLGCCESVRNILCCRLVAFYLTMSYLIKHRSLSLHCDLLASKIQLNSEKKFFKILFLFLHIHMHTSFHTWLTSSRNYNKLLTTLGKSRNFIILAPLSGDTSSSALLWGDWDLSYSKSLWQLHIISQWQWDKVSFRGHTITHSFLLPRQIRRPEP